MNTMFSKATCIPLLTKRSMPLVTTYRFKTHTTQWTEKRRTGALALKVGMLAIFDKWGRRYPVTVLHLDECQVIQVKQMATDGYTGLKLGVGEAKLKRVNITTAGQYKGKDIKPKRELQEFRVTPDAIVPVGTTIKAMHFVPGQLVDVQGISKGKGFQGVMKRHNFGGGPASHGTSLAHRVPGSIGMRQDPGRVFKGKKMPGRMGGKRDTSQNLWIVKIDPVRDLIYVKGAVPGNAGSFVKIVDAVKGPRYPSDPPFPTYYEDEDESKRLKEEVFAPMPEEDPLIMREHAQPY